MAVLEPVRNRFAAGDALFVANVDLDTVLWANGPGAGFLGFGDIETALGSDIDLGAVGRRQIMAAAGYPHMQGECAVTVRLAQGLTSLLLSALTLPDGEPAILIAAPGRLRDPAERMRRAISGFTAENHHTALVGAGGQVEASSAGFAALGIAAETLAALTQEARSESDRLVKRRIAAQDGVLLPAGLARLTDEPPLHFLLVIADGEPAAAEPVEAELPTETAEEPEAVPEQGGKAAPIPADATPVRFVWRTDEAGNFSAIGEEFVAAVGAAAASVIGESFAAAAQRLGLDPTGEVSGLLERRDTWSGRTVSWPVAGTDLAVPVDLAALPVYGRGRVFEGFRGFGVARMPDAAIDPEARGLALTPPPVKMEEPQATVEAPPRIVEPATPAPGLTNAEKNALREIGERLKQDTAPAIEEAEPVADAVVEPVPAESIAEAGDSEPPAKAPSLLSVAPDTDEADQAISTEPAVDLPDGIVQDNRPAATDSDNAPAIPTTGFTPSAFFTRRAEPRTVDTAILAKLPLPILIHAGDVLHYANREFLRLTGYSSLGEFEAAGGIDAIFVDSYEDTETSRQDGRKLRLRTRQGEEFPVDAHLQRVPWRAGQALLLALHQAAPEAPPQTGPSPVEERVAEMRAIIDTATDGVVIIDNDGMVRSISRPAEALFGLDTDDIAGKPFVQLFAIESQRAARDYLNGLSDNGVASVLNDGREVIGREAQGRFIPLFMTIGRLPNRSGYCAVVRDITQWKRAEEELTQARSQAERASSQKTDFLARVSHEIRTPLNAIIGFSELMMDEKFGPIGNDRYRDYLRDINRSGNHVLDLVNDLLDISKIEAGEQEMAYEAVSLNDALAETVAMMQPQANRDRVIIRSSFASRLPDVVADRRSIRQIALNLMSNAIRYTQAGGQVIVSTSYEPSGDLVMRIRDTGIGMSSAEIDQALKPFKQVNALKRQRGDGTGLGLPLTKAMVEANRARFVISSTPGVGTLVEITFPSTRVLAG
jgi:PAS domain S-box-containing protein